VSISHKHFLRQKQGLTTAIRRAYIRRALDPKQNNMLIHFRQSHGSCGLYHYSQNFGLLDYSILSNEVQAGFPSPATDYVESELDLGRLLVSNPSSTFFVRVKGESMQDAQIHDGDVLIVDKSIRAKDGDIAVCFLDGEFTVKRLKQVHGKFWLQPENKKFPAIPIPEQADFRVWGVVSYIIHKAR
jgi:DNA polymerase V